MQTPLLVVCGPTASGKSALAISLAKRLGGEVISADSMQVYRGMDIGTAKPSAAEMDGIPHHLLDVIPPQDDFSLPRYLKLAHEKVAEVRGRGKLPILAGGTGLYIKSLVDNIQFDEISTNPGLRRELMQIIEQKGTLYLWEQLSSCDPELAATLHPNNTGRVIRGLEVYRLTGVTMTEMQRRSREQPSPYRACMVALGFRERETLYRRIDDRVGQMLEQGLEQEAREVFQAGPSLTAAQAIGYKELLDYFEGRCTLSEAADLIRQRSRAYAKRQLTWFRRDERVRWLYWEDYENAGALVQAAHQIAIDKLNIQ